MGDFWNTTFSNSLIKASVSPQNNLKEAQKSLSNDNVKSPLLKAYVKPAVLLAILWENEDLVQNIT